MNNQPASNEEPDTEDVETFFGIPRCRHLDTLEASSVFIGAPGATSYGSMGAFCRNGPRALRASMQEELPLIDRYNFDIDGPVFPEGCQSAVDYGDLEWDENNFAKNRDLIRTTVSKVIEKGAVPILVGGDDSVPIPMLDALSDSGDQFTVIQIDAHIDWRDSHMGEKYGLSSSMRRASEMRHIKKIIQVGMRGLGSGHANDLQDALNWGVRIFPAIDIHRLGVEQVLDCIHQGTDVVMCVDVDGLDPAIVPGVIARAPGGLTYFQTLDLIKGVAEKARIVAIDFAEFCPEHDVGGMGALTVSRLIAATMGIVARQHAQASQ